MRARPHSCHSIASADGDGVAAAAEPEALAVAVLAVPVGGVQARVPVAAETEGQAAPAEDAAIDSPSHIGGNMGEAEADAFFTALLAP